MTTCPSNFFDTLFRGCEGRLEIRALPGGTRTFLELSDALGRDNFLKGMADSNLYFGVGTRNGVAGKKENILHIPCLWCDVDFKVTPVEVFKECFAAFKHEPSACVESGGGLHLYWRLRTPLTRDGIEAIEGVNRRIAQRLGGDTTATEAARILRVPGSLNYKYSPPRAVKLAVLNSNEFDLSDFDFLPELPKVSQKHENCDTEPWLCSALRGVTAGNRHHAGIRLAGYFLSRGVPVDVIEGILELWNERNTPPLPEHRLKEISRNILRYELGDRNVINISIKRSEEGIQQVAVS